MLPASRKGRTLLSGAAIAAVSALCVLAASKTVKSASSEPPPYRQTGDPGASILIVEFSDFECPACSAAHGTVKSMLAAYGKDVRLQFKHFPLERMHHSARAAAAAAECAGRQGAFWQYHDRLFERQGEWVPRGNGAPPKSWFLKYAADLSLDAKTFEACIQDPAVDAAVVLDMAEAKSRNVSATPTFFVAGRRFVGSRQLSTLGSMWIERKRKDR
ncbi:MAG: thioredoxin domain-containing protein [Elusimicrobia bacterium]|nr:thioredoxin domain-containing protein [Elusimicrobiota bacterium]